MISKGNISDFQNNFTSFLFIFKDQIYSEMKDFAKDIDYEEVDEGLQEALSQMHQEFDESYINYNSNEVRLKIYVQKTKSCIILFPAL